ncbi:MAG TPA: hypothetical protein VGH28_25415 [Polyangiaceae bacterium]
MSFWESLGEGIGYGLAALVLGPPAAISRGERRRIRLAFNAWCEEQSAVRLEGSRGVHRRSIRFRSAIGTTPAEVTLDLFSRRASIHVGIPPLPAWVRARVECEHAVRVTSDTLDLAAQRELGDFVAAGPLGELRVVRVDVASERLEVFAIAVTTLDAWRAMGRGVVALADWLADRWPVGYRG